MLRIKSFLQLILLWLVVYSPVWSVDNISKKIATQPAPHTHYRLMYTINAQRGMISLLPKSGYQLVLQKVHPVIVYQIALPKSKIKNGSVLMTQFLKIWHSERRRNITGDLTGVEVDNKTVGQEQFYQVIKLSEPRYSAKRNELTFEISFTGNFSLNKPVEIMDNPTLFINGCQLCACTAKATRCHPDFLMPIKYGDSDGYK
jgi:hypothetical protein